MLGQEHLAQIKRYAHALANHPGFGGGRWTFWLVGSAIHSDLAGDCEQSDRDWGHVIRARNYDVHVAHVGRLLDDAAAKLEFLRSRLAYDVEHNVSVARVRERHAALLPAAA